MKSPCWRAGDSDFLMCHPEKIQRLEPHPPPPKKKEIWKMPFFPFQRDEFRNFHEKFGGVIFVKGEGNSHPTAAVGMLHPLSVRPQQGNPCTIPTPFWVRILLPNLTIWWDVDSPDLMVCQSPPTGGAKAWKSGRSWPMFKGGTQAGTQAPLLEPFKREYGPQ